MAQADSTRIDTVVIKGDPVIIKRQIYVSEKIPRYPSNWELSMVGQAGINGFASTKLAQIKYKGFSQLSFKLTNELNNFAVSVGVGLEKMSGYYIHQNQPTNTNETVTYLDTLEVYYQLVNGQRTNYYITEWRDTTMSVSYSQKPIQINFSQYYLTVPLNVAYIFRFSKIQVRPSLGISTGINLHRKFNEDIAFHPLLFKFGISCEICYQLTNRFSSGIVLSSSENINNTTNVVSSNFLFLQTGLKINYYLR